jgi:hypothetical protein
MCKIKSVMSFSDEKINYFMGFFGLCIVIFALFFIIGLFSPIHLSGELKAKRYEYVTKVERLGQPKETENDWEASNGLILKEGHGTRFTTMIDADGNLALIPENYTTYTYRPWEQVIELTSSGGDNPKHADSSLYPVDKDWRRLYIEKYYWTVGEETIKVPTLKEWQNFKVGDVLAIKYGFKTLISAELLASETSDPKDFDF